MKKLLTLTVMLFTVIAFAQDKNARKTIEVDGICGMCKERIEKAAIRTKGVKSGIWSVKTHELKLIFDERKTDLETISKKLASVGHDTKIIKATEEQYNSVHPCCRYRDDDVKKDHENEEN
ncbi:ATPase [Winogradskyella sp. PC-19]|uniref:heavy-metal-associated domain-containing protein n=1 Tax=unclassified Winogradskyella TaxID=2615021 RepID=UPI000B561560|nr:MULTISPECIES: cation transporter [unclassified Winogradskyella]ARV10310.1 ATPase [Winogradskyella sp. PC-19]